MAKKLYSVKNGDAIFYVVACSYGEAVEKYKGAVGQPKDREEPCESVVANTPDPEKVTVVCKPEHFIL